MGAAMFSRRSIFFGTRRIILLACSGIVCLTGVQGTSRGQGYAPQQAVEEMTVAQSLQVELFAAEPMVRQPVCIEFDDSGRLWVIQYLQYPNPAGLKRVKVDRYSRTQYDKVPEPPPRGPRGADRISILEDTDGDGAADKVTDFVDGLNLASGLAFGHGGVYVLNVPYLLFYPDADRDDVPDSDPEVLLTGFGMEDAHSVANSLTWGPDGWLYGCQGSTVTANIRGIEFQQGVWRFHPLRKKFELFCEGGGNSWGLDFDAHGQLLYSTNWGGKVMLHGVQGAYLLKSFGKHGALHNPYAFGYFDHVPHEHFRGGHVSVGGLFYSGTTFPQSYHGHYIAGDLLGHSVYWHHLQRNGATFRSSYAGTLLAANDSWFAPTDLTLGPDGAVYVTDWHDQRTAHPDPDADWDRTNGRIYRIQATTASETSQAAAGRLDLVRSSDERLVDLATRGTDGWSRRRARRILAERRDAGAHEALRGLATRSVRPEVALRATWALYSAGGWDDRIAQQLLRHESAAVREWAVRFSGDEPQESPAVIAQLQELARHDESVRVRGQLACTARRLTPSQGLPILTTLLERDLDREDPYLPLLIWWGLEQHAVAATPRVLAALSRPALRDSQLYQSFVAPRLMQRWAAEPTEECRQAVAQLLDHSPDSQWTTTILPALAKGLASVPQRDRLEAVTPASRQILDRLRARQPWNVLRATIEIHLGNRETLARVVSETYRKTASAESRVPWVELLAASGDEVAIAPLLERVLSRETEEPLRIAAARGLSQFADPSVFDRLLSSYSSLPPDVQAAVRPLFWSREEWAKSFLVYFDQASLPSDSIPAVELAAVAVHDSPEIDALVRKHWGSIRAGSPGEKLAEVRRLNNDLNAGPGRLEAGRALFEKHCGTCHKLFDRGARVGPDLTHANRKDRAFLLRSLVDPSAQIRREYLTHVINTTDGRVLSGVIVGQDATSLTLADNRGKPFVVSRDTVEEMRESTVSLMPEDLYRQFTPQQLRDLFRFLQQ